MGAGIRPGSAEAATRTAPVQAFSAVDRSPRWALSRRPRAGSPHRVAAQHSPAPADLTALMTTGSTLLMETRRLCRLFRSRRSRTPNSGTNGPILGVAGPSPSKLFRISITAVRSSSNSPTSPGASARPVIGRTAALVVPRRLLRGQSRVVIRNCGGPPPRPDFCGSPHALMHGRRHHYRRSDTG